MKGQERDIRLIDDRLIAFRRKMWSIAGAFAVVISLTVSIGTDSASGQTSIDWRSTIKYNAEQKYRS